MKTTNYLLPTAGFFADQEIGYRNDGDGSYAKPVNVKNGRKNRGKE
ncbi:MAG: hypothetical protein JNM41_09210 [Flavipsychrobacter sp.]|nr:hypothetical protein [Flavipsychrobacter sp.]